MRVERIGTTFGGATREPITLVNIVAIAPIVVALTPIKDEPNTAKVRNIPAVVGR
jgi:hypothetical protein